MNIGQIDTRHGTANQPNFSNGNCQPYTGVSFRMNYFAPQTTDQNGSWWFHPEDRVFQGYRLTYQPSPWMGDFSHMLLMSINGKLQENTLFHAQGSYRPGESIFCPTHLSIRQLRYGVRSTLISSMYSGILFVDYSRNDSGLLLSFSGRHQLFVIDPYTVGGKITHFAGSENPDFSFYFILRFEYPLTIGELAVSNKNSDSTPLYFEQTKKQITRFGTPFISSEQAAYNLELEQNQNKEIYLANSQKQQQSYSGRIQLTHHDQQQLRTFYRNFYRVFLFPQTFYEMDPGGQKIHYDTTSRSVKPGVLYTNNGFWDTYKTIYSLYSLIAVEEYEEVPEGFLNSYRENGYLPKWLSPDERGLIPGTLTDAVVADAAVKGIRPGLTQESLTAMKKGAIVQSNHPSYERQGTKDYLTHSYVPNHYHESVNHTLDYAYSDSCISQVAKVLAEDETVRKYQ